MNKTDKCSPQKEAYGSLPPNFCLLFVLLISGLMFSACIEPIRFEINRDAGQLIIDGSLTNQEGPQTLKLARTSANARIPELISGAQALIYDGSGQSESYVEDNNKPGTYIFQGQHLKPEIGQTYFLEVILPDGQVYRSKAETMLAHPAELLSIDYDFSLREEANERSILTKNLYMDVFIEVEISQVDQEAFFLKWDVEEVYLVSPTDFPDPFGSIPPPCYVYVYPNAGSLSLFDGSNNQAQFLNQVHVATQKVGFEFSEKHYFSVYQQSISQEAFEYWESVDQLISNVGNIFDTPPAPIVGNIVNVDRQEEEVLGYFGVYSQTIIRFFTIRSDIPVNRVLECEYMSTKANTDYPDYCLNCLRLRNSTYTRPGFF